MAETDDAKRPEWLKYDENSVEEGGVETENENSQILAGSAPSSAAYSADGEHWLLKWQHLAGILSHLLAIAAVVTVCVWVSDEAMGGGGVSWKEGDAKRVFNWHPVMMIVCFSFMTVSALTFFMRWRSPEREINKALHVLEWSAAAICAIVGIVAVVKSHNDPVSGFIANLYSLHSWIGVAVIILYVCQFLVGVFSFGLTIRSIGPRRRAEIMTVHRFMGALIYGAVASAILLGIQEKDGFVGCGYAVTKADVFPPIHFGEIPRACKISHGLGVIVFAMTICTAFALHEFSDTPPQRTNGRRED